MTEKRTLFPLLQSQEGVYMSWVSDPALTTFNLPSVLAFPLQTDVERLWRAVLTMVRRQRVLLTRFVNDGAGGVRQYCDGRLEVAVPRRSLSEEAFNHYVSHDFVRPFLPDSPFPLCRFEIITTPLHHYLLSDLHHAIADGYTISRNMLCRDLQAAWAEEGGKDAPGVDNIIMYESAVAEARAMGGEAYKAGKDYFCKMFRDVEFIRFGRMEHDGIGDEITQVATLHKAEVDRWCRGWHTSPQNLLMAAFALAAAKLLRQRRVAFFTLYHGRGNRQEKDAWGMFVKSVPIVVETGGYDNVLAMVQDLGHQLFRAIRHSAYPSTHFCRDMGVSPVVTFAFQGDAISENIRLGDVVGEGRQLPHGRVRKGLDCMVYTTGEAYEIRIISSSGVVHSDEAAMIAGAVRQCALQMMASPHAGSSLISLVAPEELPRLEALGRGPSVDYDRATTVAQMILKQAQRFPERVAVSDEKGSLTYADLDNRSRQMAGVLASQGVRPGHFVCLLMDAEKEFVVMALALWRIGAAYVPVDPSLPPERMKEIVGHSRAKLVVTTRRGEPEILNAPAFLENLDNLESLENLEPLESLESLENLESLKPPAYMIYTSGSSGQPKGVVIGQGALLNFVHFIAREWRLTEHSRIACHSPFSFDASVEDLFPALTVGGTVLIVPKALRTDIEGLRVFLRDNRVTGGCFTTRLGLMLLDEPLPPSMEYICLGGEKLHSCPPASLRVFNTYGPTECTVDATFYEIPRGQQLLGDSIPIGRPLPGIQAWVMDPDGQPLPQGAVGELWLGGVQTALGYWQAKELTARHFLNDPCTGMRVFRTGDLVKWDRQGNLVFVGREDRQVKRNGYRLELSETEHFMMKIEGVKDVAVVARQSSGNTLVTAFYTTSSSEPLPHIRHSLAQWLPPYALPQAFVHLSALPCLISGKIDYSRLCSLADGRRKGETPSPSPKDTASEGDVATLCRLFDRVLDVEGTGPDDDFFELGGTSITVMQLVAEARKCGISVGYGDVFQRPTPKLLGTATPSSEGERPIPIVCAASPKKEALGACVEPLFLLTGATGFLGSHILRELAETAETKVVCLVRNKEGRGGRERLEKVYQYYFGRSLPRNVTVVEGDITDSSVLPQLDALPVTHCIHCAANVNFHAPGNALEDTNTKGTKNIADYCFSRGCGLTFISTLSVETGFVNPYIHSKQRAEKVVCDAAAHGLKAQIVRTGMVAPRASDGIFQKASHHHALMASLRLLAAMKVFPEEIKGLKVDFSPVDGLARAICLLASQAFSPTAEESGAPVFSLCRLPLVPLSDLLERFAGARPVAMSTLIDMMTTLPPTSEKAALGMSLDFLASVADRKEQWLRSVKLLEKQAADTQERLSSIGFSWPELGNDYFRRLFGL